MSGITKDSDEDSGEVTGRNEPPKYNWDEYFRFRPIAFTQFLLAEIDSYKGDKEKRDYYTALLRLICLAIIGNLPMLLVVIGVVGLSGYLLYEIGFFDSNRVIAVFTVVLAGAAAVQWWTSHRQWEAMRSQNRIMVRQANQTDKMIEQMRLGQRAWLYTDTPTVARFTTNRVIIDIPVHNAGSVPANIFRASIWSVIRSATVATWQVFTEFEERADYDVQTYEVAPRDNITIRTADLELYDGAMESLNKNAAKLYVLCKFPYTDILGTDDEVAAVYIYDFGGSGFMLQGDFKADQD